jgi:hypothetical protein
MWADVERTRAIAVTTALKELAPEDDRAAYECALGMLFNLAQEAANRESMWMDEEGTRTALIHAAHLTEPRDRKRRLLAVRALQNLAVEPRNREKIWMDGEGARAVFSKAAMSDDPEEGMIRLFGVAGLQHLGSEQVLKEEMWADEAGARAALVKVASAKKPADGDEATEQREARERALSALQSLSAEVEIKVPMWNDVQTREAFVAAARFADPGDVRARSSALGALQNISSEEDVKLPMWQDVAGCRSVLVEAAKITNPAGRDGRDRAVAALWNLSTDPDVRSDDIWLDKDATGPVCVLEMTAHLNGDDDRKARGYALAALQALGK